PRRGGVREGAVPPGGSDRVYRGRVLADPIRLLLWRDKRGADADADRGVAPPDELLPAASREDRGAAPPPLGHLVDLLARAGLEAAHPDPAHVLPGGQRRDIFRCGRVLVRGRARASGADGPIGPEPWRRVTGVTALTASPGARYTPVG